MGALMYKYKHKQEKNAEEGSGKKITGQEIKSEDEHKELFQNLTSSRNSPKLSLTSQNPASVYVFKINLKDSPKIWRKIEIKGSQTLHHLHKAIFEAYERYDEHLYAFFMSNKPWNRLSKYGPPYPESNAQNSKSARIESLGLHVKTKFLYLFDFGDEWWHSIQLLGIKEEEFKGTYPRIIESQGEAPPQYPVYEEDDE
jgi:hypothetical protein